MRCAARRISLASTALLWPPSSLPLTTSQSLKRTSKRPSARRVTEPATSASAARERHCDISGRAPSSKLVVPVSTIRNAPLRSRSARMIADGDWPLLSSSRKRTIAIGSWVAPTPEISTRNCAAAGARGEREQRRRTRRGARNESGTMTSSLTPSGSHRRRDRRPRNTNRHDMRPNESLAVVIVAKNEAARIGDCIASASFADEVLVLDSGSTDGTAADRRGGRRARRRHRLAGLRPAGGARLLAGDERLGALARRRRAHPAGAAGGDPRRDRPRRP